ncbi:S9 family peptidase [Pleionea sp. CnH1-48]|uniref:alpha/beta hydrolase family protein n=1 Tax=Pleionea sp. CnH1-48 TaxID=2954494 RepID=UPI002097341C|nr:prolyl oligopeptidase family serine peptidase [Pleionea sp. CnH1-48]MCO7224311.1 prolyl oligopeptidase family serine peptidase [Pleionea sp. CnH1-48]
MKKIILYFCLGILGSYAKGETKLVDERSCFSGPFASYESWKKVMTRKKGSTEAFLKAFPKDEYESYKAKLVCKNIIYKVGSTFVKGFYITTKERENTKSPTVIFNRGGNAKYGNVVFGYMMRRLFPLVEDGFAVIGSQYRGGSYWSKNWSNQEDNDEFGGQDVEDVIALHHLLPEFPGIDTKRVGMMGASRGGMQTMLALKTLTDIKATVLVATPVDLVEVLKERPKMERVYKARIPGYEEDKEGTLNQRSILKFLHKTNESKILILHANDDKRVSANHALKLAMALNDLNRPYKMVMFEQGGHSIRLDREEVNEQITSWFRKYLTE